MADNTQAQPANKGGSIVKTCLIGCFVLFLIVLVVGGGAAFWIYRNAGRLAADFGDSTFGSLIDQSELPADQKVAVKAEVKRVTDALREGDLDAQDLANGVQQLTESPVMTVIVVAGIREAYLKKSGLSPEEQADGERALQRVGRGVMEKTISESQVKELMKLVGTVDAQGNISIKENLTDDELRLFLAEAKRLADAAEVPDEEYTVDIVDEVRKIVDRILAAEEPAPPEVEIPGIDDGSESRDPATTGAE